MVFFIFVMIVVTLFLLEYALRYVRLERMREYEARRYQHSRNRSPLNTYSMYDWEKDPTYTRSNHEA